VEQKEGAYFFKKTKPFRSFKPIPKQVGFPKLYIICTHCNYNYYAILPHYCF